MSEIRINKFASVTGQLEKFDELKFIVTFSPRCNDISTNYNKQKKDNRLAVFQERNSLSKRARWKTCSHRAEHEGNRKAKRGSNSRPRH